MRMRIVKDYAVLTSWLWEVTPKEFFYADFPSQGDLIKDLVKPRTEDLPTRAKKCKYFMFLEPLVK